MHDAPPLCVIYGQPVIQMINVTRINTILFLSFIGKKSVSENSSYFVFIKCADGGFEASPLADWYSFAPHKTYKTLDYDEAEDQFKIRHKTLNKYYIMANKRKNEGNEDDEDEDEKGTGKSGVFSSFGLGSKASKDNWVSDGEDDNKKGRKKKSDYKASNLSDDDDDDDEEMMSSKGKGGKKKNDDDDDIIAKEDSDDGDHEGYLKFIFFGIIELMRKLRKLT